MKSFEDLECWKAGREVRTFFCNAVKTLPAAEKIILGNNVKRAAYSVTNNIAEGYGRYHYQENIQFCRISRGSLYELSDQLIIMLDESFLSQTNFDEGKVMLDKATGLLNGYINYLKRAKDQESGKSGLQKQITLNQ